MPRANRYIVPGRTYHLTHRCHNGAFLLKFERDRERDAKWTESLAVGSEAFVKEVGRQIRNRMGVELVDEQAGDGTWLVREAQAAYGSFSG
jgi:REP element-mobilizing transposase RayT